MSWKPAYEADIASKEKLDNENNETSINKKTFDNMDLVDRRDKLGHIKSFGGFGDSPFFRNLKSEELDG